MCSPQEILSGHFHAVLGGKESHPGRSDRPVGAPSTNLCSGIVGAEGEVGCRGFPAQSVWNLMMNHGKTNQIVQRLKEESENMSAPVGSGKRGATLAGSLKGTRLTRPPLATNQLESVVVVNHLMTSPLLRPTTRER